MAIKKSFETLNTALTAYDQTATVADLMADTNFTKLMEAKKGGFSGVDSFVTIGDDKVARICAMTGAVFSHDNTDKELSFFYKNGSYMIGAEVLKANSRKQWEMDREDQETELEDQMLEGDISPKEWKEATTALHATTFDYTMTDEDKAELIETFEGYPTKEAFTEAYNEGTVKPFSDFSEEIAELREQAPKRAEAEPTEEA